MKPPYIRDITRFQALIQIKFCSFLYSFDHGSGKAEITLTKSLKLRWLIWSDLTMQFLQALRNSVKRLQADFEDSKLFEHRGDKGEFREWIIENFLRPFLPDCYGLSSGAVFSVDGKSSSQIDIVIYDAVFSNILFRNAKNSLFPCESVYGNIEVKSVLSSNELDIAVDNVASLKKLNRTPSDILDFLPFRRINLGAGLTYNRSQMNPYLGIIFAYDGLIAETVIENLNSRISKNSNEKETLPNFVFNYKKGYMVLRGRKSEMQIVPASISGEFDFFISVDIGSDTLPMFFLTVNTCLNQIILKAPDFNQYWLQIFREALQEKS